MRACYVENPNPDDPLGALRMGESPEPEPAAGWTTVRVMAAALNHHDLFSLAGLGLPAERCPMILGTDAAGIDANGTEVVVHSVIASPGWTGEETLDPKRTLLSELHQGTLAERVTVPAGNLVAKPPELSFEQAACLPTAWLTAYRMLFSRSGLRPGHTVLVQGASGGVATAAIALGRAGGFRVWVTGRSEAKRDAALALGAHAAYPPGARLPDRVDAVIETVGKATWEHSVRSLRPGGTIVTAGATSGEDPPASLTRIFFQQLRVVGSTMGTKADLASLLAFLQLTGLRPAIGQRVALTDVAEGFAAMAAGRTAGKIVVTVDRAVA